MTRRSDIGMPGNIPEQPEGGPETSHIVLPRELNLRFDNAPRETEFVPRLEHGGGEMFLVHLGVEGFVVDSNECRIFCLGFDDQCSVLRLDIVGGVVVQSSVGIIVLVQCGPLGISAVLKGSAVLIEFIGEDQLVIVEVGGVHGGSFRRSAFGDS